MLFTYIKPPYEYSDNACISKPQNILLLCTLLQQNCKWDSVVI